MRINATFFIGAILMLICFAIQHGGILRSAKVTKIMGIAALLPLMLIGIVPLITGDLPRENFLPLVPLGHDAAGAPIDGTWDKAGWILFIGGLFIAAWSTYGFETAVCYTREFKDPETRYVQGHLLLRPHVPRGVHPCAALLPGRSRFERNAGA